MPHWGALMHQKCFVVIWLRKGLASGRPSSLVLLKLKLVSSSGIIKTLPWTHYIFLLHGLTHVIREVQEINSLSTTLSNEWWEVGFVCGGLFLNNELGQLRQFCRVNMTSEVSPEQNLNEMMSHSRKSSNEAPVLCSTCSNIKLCCEQSTLWENSVTFDHIMTPGFTSSWLLSLSLQKVSCHESAFCNKSLSVRWVMSEAFQYIERGI